jgi:hypothetical protein
MKELTTLYPRIIPIAENMVIQCERAGVPIVIFCTRRNFEEQKKIYPNNPTRFSHHLWGGAIDVYPAEYRTWGKEFQKKFDGWKHWKKVRDIGTACGFDPPQKFNDSDQPHFQKLFGMPVELIKTYWNNTKGGEEEKLRSVWHYLDAHNK